MSLTHFITQPDVKAKLRETFPTLRVHLEKRPLIAPLTTHYQLIGTAFDYLLRFALQHRYAHAVAQPWVAELVTTIHYPHLVATVGEEKGRAARQFVEQCKDCHAKYLQDGLLTDELLQAVLRLSHLDPFFRAGVLYEPFGEVDASDVEDLRRLFAVTPFEHLTPQSLCLLDPTFAASRLVKGADVDLVIDDIMIDIKTTQALQMKREYFDQLLGYYTLSLLGGVSGMPESHAIRSLGIYFSRYGYLYQYPLDQIASDATFQDFAAWFARRAHEYSGTLTPPRHTQEYSGVRTPLRSATNAREKLLLIDGGSLIPWADWSIPGNLVTKKGERVNATFGVTSLVFRAFKELKPNYAAVAFDGATPTFRHRQFAQYKARQPFYPEALIPQRQRIRELVQALGIPLYECDEYEAGDVLGTLVQQATKQGMDTVIVTCDRDTLQLVDEQVSVFFVKSSIVEWTKCAPDDVRRLVGVVPAHIPAYRGLAGKQEANLPKVKGLGEQTAKDLVSRYDGDLNALFSHKDNLPARVKTALRDQEAAVRQRAYLATITRDAPVQLDLHACRVGHLDQARAIEILRELEFRTLIAHLSVLSSE